MSKASRPSLKAQDRLPSAWLMKVGSKSSSSSEGPKMSAKEWTFRTFDQPDFSKLALAIAVLGFAMIITSAIIFTFETLPQFHDDRSPAWDVIEYMVVGWFTLDYVVRLLSCENRYIFVKQPFNIVDVLAVLPFYIELAVSSKLAGLGVIRVIRLTRVFRVFKLSRHSSGFMIFGTTLKNSMDALGLLSFLLMIWMLVFSSALYYAELMESDWDATQQAWIRFGEEVPSPFQSIPETFWWCIVTMTTVGYGDAVPKSTGGKFVGVITMVCGILIIAFPISVIGASFTDTWNAHKAAKKKKAQENIENMNRALKVGALASKWVKRTRYNLAEKKKLAANGYSAIDGEPDSAMTSTVSLPGSTGPEIPPHVHGGVVAPQGAAMHPSPIAPLAPQPTVTLSGPRNVIVSDTNGFPVVSASSLSSLVRQEEELTKVIDIVQAVLDKTRKRQQDMQSVIAKLREDAEASESLVGGLVKRKSNDYLPSGEQLTHPSVSPGSSVGSLPEDHLDKANQSLRGTAVINKVNNIVRRDSISQLEEDLEL